MLQINDSKKVAQMYFLKYIHVLNTKTRKRDGVITISFNDKLIDYKMTVPKNVYDIISQNIFAYKSLVKYYKQEHDNNRLYVIDETDDMVKGFDICGNGPKYLFKNLLKYETMTGLELIEDIIRKNNCIPEIEYVTHTFVLSRLKSIKNSSRFYQFSVNFSVNRIHYTMFVNIQREDNNLFAMNIKISLVDLNIVNGEICLINDRFMIDDPDKINDKNLETILFNYLFKIVEISKYGKLLQ